MFFFSAVCIVSAISARSRTAEGNVHPIPAFFQESCLLGVVLRSGSRLATIITIIDVSIYSDRPCVAVVL